MTTQTVLDIPTQRTVTEGLWVAKSPITGWTIAVQPMDPAHFARYVLSVTRANDDRSARTVDETTVEIVEGLTGRVLIRWEFRPTTVRQQEFDPAHQPNENVPGSDYMPGL